MATTNRLAICMKCGNARVLYDINPTDEKPIGDIWWCNDCCNKKVDSQ